MASPSLLLPDLRDLTPERPLVIGQVYGCAAAILLSEMLHRATGPLLAITATVAEAETLQAQLDFFMGAERTLLFPDPETLAYDVFSPHQDLVSRRLAVLARLQEPRSSHLTIVAAPTLLQRLPPKSYIAANSLSLRSGQALNIADLQLQLVASGYTRVSQVTQHGEFARRGSLVDLFPMGSELPVRIDFFDAEIDSIRYFDPDTQLSDQRLDELTMLPARDFPTTPDAIREFRSRFRERFEGNPDNSLIYKEVSEGRYPGGIENYLPMFFPATCSFWDYLPPDCDVINIGATEDALAESWEQSCLRYEQYRHDVERPVLGPDELFVSPAEHNTQLASRKQIYLRRRTVDAAINGINLPAAPAPAVLINTHAEKPAAELVQYLQAAQERILICAESTGRREMLNELLRDHGCPIEPIKDWNEFRSGKQRLSIVVTPLDGGVLLTSAGITLLAENELFGTRTTRRRRKKVRDPEAILNDLSDLYPGTPVVHLYYGVGRYQGLSHLVIDQVAGDFLTLEYAGGDRLYVPVGSLQLISRYTGASPDNAPLHRLGTDQWAKARRKAAAQIRDVAAEMLDLYATRAARKGRSFAVNQGDYGDLNKDEIDLVESILRQFVSDPAVAEALLGFALDGKRLDTGGLAAQFDGMGFDRETLPLDFGQAMDALGQELESELLQEASKPNSPLFNRLVLANLGQLRSAVRPTAQSLLEVSADQSRIEAMLLTVRFTAITAQHVNPEQAWMTSLGSLDRPEVDEILSAVGECRAVLLIGEGGSGKSGILAKVVLGLQSEGRPVLCISVDSYPRGTNSVQSLDALLQLGMPVFDALRLLAEQGQQPVLVCDQLDDVAGTDLSRLLCTFLSNIGATLPDVVVIAASRLFEAEHNRELRNLPFRRVESRRLEAETARKHLQELGIVEPGSELTEVARNLLALSMIAELAGAGEAVAEITGQIELWQLYRRSIQEREGAEALQMAVQIAREACRQGTREFSVALTPDSGFAAADWPRSVGQVAR